MDHTHEPDYRSLFESMPSLYLVLLPDAPRYTILAASDAYLRATMTKREEIRGRGVFEVFPDNPDDATATGARDLRASLDSVVRERAPSEMPIYKYDIRRPRENAAREHAGFEERWWSLRNTPVLGSNGELAYILCHAEDMTALVELRSDETEQRRRAIDLDTEVRLRASQLEEANRKLNEANAQMNELLSMISHDLRNPLGTILLSAELLRRPATDPARSTRDPGDVIARAAKRMERLIQELLDVSRIEGGAFSIEAGRVSVGELLNETLEAQRGRAAAAQIELRLDLADGVRDVWADRHRLLQVLENLIGNALKFTGAGGTITIGARPKDGDVLFWTKDTGPGIAPEDQAHLFERFWRANKSGRRGAGLGLAIVKGIVDAHGGRVWVESAVGEGSTFFFTMPAAARREQSHQAHA